MKQRYLLIFIALLSASVAAARSVLSGDLDLYVASSGSDSNDGLTTSTALATLQAAADVATHEVDAQGFTVTIHVASGTYTHGALLAPVFDGRGKIVGDESTPSNVLVSVNSTAVTHINLGESCFDVQPYAFWEIRGVKMETSGVQASCIFLEPHATLYWGHCDFGSSTRMHIENRLIGYALAVADYTISGSAGRHICTHNNSTSVLSGIPNGTATPSPLTITLINTPAFSFAFVDTYRSGTIIVDGARCSFSGSATGKRYQSDLNGCIDTQGAGANFLPGNVAGQAVNGGIYN